MANARGKTIDNTHLSIDVAESRGFVHRDYVAHCLRWTFVANRLGRSGRYRTSRVLDVGCGSDLPLAKMLYSSKFIVQQYVGVDYNSPDKLKMGPFHSGKFPIRAFGGVDFADDEQVNLYKNNEEIDPEDAVMGGNPYYRVLGTDFLLPNVITCFEVLEHVEPEHAVRMLKKFSQFLHADPAAEAFISTPCYDPKVGAAGNHVNEMRREALESAIESCGMHIVENYGTFASQRDYRDQLFHDYPDAKKLWAKLQNYYDSNYIATIFAPLYPEGARNNLWVLKSKDARSPRVTKYLQDLPKPWTSSERWEDLASAEEGLTREIIL